jgi:hypothetical protein
MIEAVKIWNEPNNKSHWDPNLDPEWDLFAEMTRLTGQAIAAEAPGLTRVLGGMSPIDPSFLDRLEAKGALDVIDVVAVHGFPLDWNLWSIDDWPAKLAEIQAVTDKPVWVTEVGVSSFGSEEVQAWGVKKTAELLIGRAPRIHWYSLYDLPRTWEATTRHKEAEGSSYYRHFHMGLLREDGTPKPGLEVYADYAERDGPLPVVPLRGPSAGRGGRLAEAAGRAPPAHRALVGRQLSAPTPWPGSTGRWRRWRTSTSPSPSASRPSIAASSPPHQPAPGRRGVRPVLRGHGAALRASCGRGRRAAARRRLSRGRGMRSRLDHARPGDRRPLRAGRRRGPGARPRVWARSSTSEPRRSTIRRHGTVAA